MHRLQKRFELGHLADLQAVHPERLPTSYLSNLVTQSLITFGQHYSIQRPVP